jgi:hypothetical protein
VAKLKYLGTIVNNQIYTNEEVRRKLNWGNACHHSFYYLLSSHPISKNAMLKIYEIIILIVILYECETWSVIQWNNVD